MSLCVKCLADPSFFERNEISPTTVIGYCPFCGSTKVPIVGLQGIADPARSSRLTWKRWCEAAKQGAAGVEEYADMFYDLMVDLSQLSSRLSAGTILFRARAGYQIASGGRKRPHEGDEIGAPPDGHRYAGRANREDISVLYCAEQEATAVAEIRPARKQYVSVCEARVLGDTSILDVTATPSRGPFPSGEAYGWLEILGFLRAFEVELAKPLERGDDRTEYLPCQLFAESVEHAGMLGLRYRSATQPNGTNVVLFDPNGAQILDSRLVQVTNTQISYELRPTYLFLPEVVE